MIKHTPSFITVPITLSPTMRLRPRKRPHSTLQPSSSESPPTPSSPPQIIQSSVSLPSSLTPTQINHLRILGSFPSPPASPQTAIPFLCHHLLSIQAQDADATLHQIWNRLSSPRSSRTVLSDLSLHGPSKAGVVRIWAQRCTLQLVTETDWGMLSACASGRITKMRESSASKYDLVDVLHELEHRFETELAKGNVSSKVVDDWIQEKGISGDGRLTLRYSIPVLASLHGKAYRILGENNRVCMKGGKAKAWNEEKALVAAAERYFTAYGPATEGDFRYWMYISASKSKEAVKRVVTEGKVVSIGDMLIGKERLADVERIVGDQVGFRGVLLLGRFDAMILAHKDKSWIVDEEFRRRIWSTHSEVSACVIVDGRIVGKWRHERGSIFVTLFQGELENEVLDAIERRGMELLRGFYEREGEVVVECEGRGVVRGDDSSRRRQKKSKSDA